MVAVVFPLGGRIVCLAGVAVFTSTGNRAVRRDSERVFRKQAAPLNLDEEPARSAAELEECCRATEVDLYYKLGKPPGLAYAHGFFRREDPPC